ncbi:MAG: D-alanine--D-alanine ligase, partial [Eubacteriales bacterium]
ELTKKMQGYALRAYRALKLESYGRIDVMMDENNEMYCLEANTLPGMTPTSLLPQEAAALGMDFASLCEKLIKVSVREGTSCEA